MSVTRLPASLRILLAGINLLGISLAAWTFLRGDLHGSLPLLVIAIMAALAAPQTVTIGARMDMSSFHPFILSAMLLLGTGEALITSRAAIIALSFVSKRRWEAYRFLFNLNGMLVTTWVTCKIYQLAGGRAGAPVLERGLPALMTASVG